MKTLFFTYDFPVPITSGGKNRAYHMLKYGTKGIKTILFSFYREVPDNESIAAIESLGIENIRLFKRPLANFKSLAENPVSFFQNFPALVKILNPVTSITKKLYFNPEIAQELVNTVREEKISVVHFESLYTAYYYSDVLEKEGVKQVFGTENIEYKLYQEYAKTAANKLLIPMYLFESKKIKNDEHNLLNSFKHSMAVSSEDADVITQITSRPSEIIKNGVDINTFSYKNKKVSDKPTLLFVGNFSYFPNITAVRDFYENVFKDLNDDFRLRVIGRDVNSLGIEDDRVTKLSYVKDIRDEYYNADIFVFPIKIGGGTNFKVVEAMSCGLPIVGYGQRLKPMGVSNNQEAFMVSDEKEFKSTLTKVSKDSKVVDKITKNARKFVEQNYSWEVIGKELNEYWKGLV